MTRQTAELVLKRLDYIGRYERTLTNGERNTRRVCAQNLYPWMRFVLSPQVRA
jgi:hypothetical protein